MKNTKKTSKNTQKTVNLLSQNSKMIKSSTSEYAIHDFRIIAKESRSGFITCPSAGECKKYCFGCSGRYRFKNVASKGEINLSETFKDLFVNNMTAEIQALSVRYKRSNKQLIIRIHSTGDFYNYRYLSKWLNIINNCKNVLFYCYTKSVDLFKCNNITIPSNFSVCYSYGGTHDDMIDTERDCNARIFESTDELIDAGYIDASNNDLHIILGDQKIGLLVHRQTRKQFKAA